MKTARYIFSFLFIVMLMPGAFGQSIWLGIEDKKNDLVQFSGVVVTADSLKPVPYTNIRIDGTNMGTMANYEGFFSFVAHRGDRLIFTSIGYRKSYFKIPDTLTQNRYSLFQMMQNDTIVLTETVIYPWPNIEQLEFAIVHHRVPQNDYDRAMKNLALQEMKERAEDLDFDGAMNYRYDMGEVVRKSYYAGQYMPYQFLNPFAWAEFFEAWKEGKFKRKD